MSALANQTLKFGNIQEEQESQPADDLKVEMINPKQDQMEQTINPLLTQSEILPDDTNPETDVRLTHERESI